MRTLLQYLGLILVAILVGMPVWWAINTSLQPLESVYSSHFQIWPDHPQWSNYTDAVSRLPFLRFLFNSLIITTTAVFGTVLSTSMAGYVFARLRWTGRSWCFGILMGTLLIPSQVYLIPHFLMFERLGWLNTYKPLIVPGFLAMDVFYVFLFRQFFRSVPLAYTEAALVDGATHWTIYRRILLPMSKPVVITVIVMNAVFHWQDLMTPLIYLNDIEKFPLALGLRMYQTMDGDWVNHLMAASLLSLIPVTLLFFLTQRYLMRGLVLTEK